MGLVNPEIAPMTDDEMREQLKWCLRIFASEDRLKSEHAYPMARNGPNIQIDIPLRQLCELALKGLATPAPEERTTEAYANGYSTAIETAAQHVGWQHVVWDMTDIPPRALLDMLEKNIRALDGPPRPGEPTPQSLPVKEE